MFDIIDATGRCDKRDPRMRDVEAEMIRSHELCLKISSKKPTDPDYKALLEEIIIFATFGSSIIRIWR